MAYEMVMPYHLHMPSYFLETFTEYPSLLTGVCEGAEGFEGKNKGNSGRGTFQPTSHTSMGK